MQNNFNIGEIVYLIHDIDQKPIMINTIIITKNDILYELILCTQVSNHYGYELNCNKTIF